MMRSKKHSVILMAWVLAVLLLAGCAGGEPRSATATDTSGTGVEIQENQTGIESWPEDIPSDVPRFEKGKIMNGSLGVGKYMLVFDGITDEDTANYIAVLEGAGYEKTSEQEIAGGILVELNNGIYEISVNHANDSLILDITSLEE